SDNFTRNLPLYQSDIPIKKIKGRPFGGQCWLLDNTCELLGNEFLGRHLSYIHIKIHGYELVIIGVYMPFYNRKNKNKNQPISSDIPVVVLGDFNEDFFRPPGTNPFDQILLKFVNDHDFLPVDTIQVQRVPFTYSKSGPNNFVLIECNILDDEENLSDHRALNLNVLFQKRRGSSQKDYEPTPTNHSNNINFTNADTLNFYNSSLSSHLRELCSRFVDPGNPVSDCQVHIDEFYNKICKSINLAVSETKAYEFSLSQKCSINNQKTAQKKNSWFDHEMKRLKQELVSLRDQIKLNATPELIEKRKQLKKVFRRTQRQNLYLQEVKQQEKLETLSRLKNKNKFWRFIRNNTNIIIKEKLDNLGLNRGL
ncbi:hypothetical protein BpHYR1_025999, partial [Brachionus plicatilis]